MKEQDLISKATTESVLAKDDLKDSVYLSELKKYYPIDEAYDRLMYLANCGLFPFVERVYKRYKQNKHDKPKQEQSSVFKGVR